MRAVARALGRLTLWDLFIVASATWMFGDGQYLLSVWQVALGTLVVVLEQIQKEKGQ